MSRSIARTSIVSISVLSILVFMKLYSREASPASVNVRTVGVMEPDADVGDRLCLSTAIDGRVGNHRNSILVVISATCPACREITAFTDRLNAAAVRNGLDVLYVVPVGPTHDPLQRSLSQQGRLTVRVRLEHLGVTRVPSIVTIDAAQTILAMWTGTVPKQWEDSVIADLVEPPGKRRYDLIRSSQNHQPIFRVPYQLLVFHSGHNRPGAKVIPAQQLAIRARYELDEGKEVVVDCATTPSARQCQEALLTLFAIGFRSISALDLEPRVAECPEL